MIQILTNALKNTSSAIITMDTDNAILYIEGTFSAETVTINRLSPDDVVTPLTGGVITVAGEKLVQLFRGARIQLSISNGAGTPSINAFYASRVDR